MSLHIVDDMRRELRALRVHADAGTLTPLRFKHFTEALGHQIDTAEAYLDAAELAGVIPGTPQLRLTNEGMAAVMGLTTCNVRFKRGLGVIDGGKA
ncbi:MAG: hypothetical protein JWP35_3508 [Caulobacter sp.]|nr:hypothetical protein [Caulobacter sp.]